MHEPVLLQEVIKFLDPRPGEFFIDGTVDGGGHAAAILKLIMPRGKFLGVDWDLTMLKHAEEKIAAISNFESLISKRITLVHGNYADLPKILEIKNLPKADGLLLDLGFSSEQLENSGRGFSFLKNEPLLMTYDGSRKPVKEILKEIGEKELAEIIFRLGGEKFRGRIARAIKERQSKKAIVTSNELAQVVQSAVPKNYERGRIHPATRTFQALRIYANGELENLEKFLRSLPEILKQGGRAAIISFHSLEDKIVKNSFRDMAENNILKILTKKPASPTIQETKNNPRSRSARLRAALIS